jgi:hypothetical protein
MKSVVTAMLTGLRTRLIWIYSRILVVVAPWMNSMTPPTPKGGPSLFYRFSEMASYTADMRWMNRSELRRCVDLLVELLGLDKAPWMVLASRLLRLWRLGNTKYTVNYMKECRLAIIAWANGTPYTPNPGVRVRRRPSGWPAIVPSGLRLGGLTTLSQKVQFRALHTVFNLYRVMDWKGALPDFTSITNPFTGISEVLFRKELEAVLKLFPVVRFPSGSVAPWVSVSAGPNHPWATWSSGLDAIAWGFHGYLWVAYVSFAWATKQYLLAIWLTVLSHLMLPVALYFRLKGRILHLGRLSVLAKDGGGKRRIVGIVDFWSQWLLKPLHLYLFEVLRKIPQDGTFDQLAPVSALLDYARLGMQCFSFDLSNATDRLPVKLQEQILGIITGPLLAVSWRVLLTRRTYYHQRTGGLRYAVGQPMGALSSWAMLAVTHHVIVQVAAYRSGFQGWYPFYAVLGDDVVILGDRVAQEYLSIMRYLGVPINMGKSISSERGLLEFAKRVVSAHHGDLSGVSGRNLLQSVRQPRLLADLLVHVLNLGLFQFPSQVRQAIRRSAGFFLSSREVRGVSARLLVVRAFALRRYHGVCRLPSASNWSDEWCLSLLSGAYSDIALAWAVSELVHRTAARLYESDYRRAIKATVNFFTNWWRYPLFQGARGGFLSLPLVILSPAFWSHIRYLFAANRFFWVRISARLTARGVGPSPDVQIALWPFYKEGQENIRDPDRYGSEALPGPPIADLDGVELPVQSLDKIMEDITFLKAQADRFQSSLDLSAISLGVKPRWYYAVNRRPYLALPAPTRS